MYTNNKVGNVIYKVIEYFGDDVRRINHFLKNIAYFDYDKLTFPLTLRTWKEGDWFIPFGMKGRKKLSDYFSDHKFSRLDKERTWLLCSGGAVIWIVRERSDNRFCLDKTTKSVLVVNFFPTKSESN